MSVLRRKLTGDIRAHRAQFIAVAATVFLGIAMFGASYDSFLNLEASYEETAEVTRFADVTMQGGDVATFADQAGAVATAVETRTVADIPLRLGDSSMLGRVVGMSSPEPGVNRLILDRGELPSPGSVAIDFHLSDHHGLEPGDTIAIRTASGWVDVPVAGVASSAEYLWPARSRQEIFTTPEDFGVVYALQGDAAEWSGSDTNEAVVYLAQPTDEAVDSLTADAVELGAIDVFVQADQPSNAALEEDLAGFEELSVFFPILFLSAAGMAALVLITRMVHAQRSQVGIMLANGFTARQVRRHYLGYGLVPGTAGAVTGAIAGALLAGVVTSFYTDTVGIPIRVVEFHPETMVAALALGIGATLVAAWLPARAAARTVPAEAMRGLAPTVEGGPSLIERLVPFLRSRPISWRMTLRGIERSPRRTLSTALGVVLSLMLIMVSWGMLDTVEFLMDRQFTVTQAEDATVYFEQPGNRTSVGALASTDGVSLVEPTFQVPASASAGTVRLGTTVVLLDEGSRLHGFVGPDGDPRTLGSSGALIGAGVAEALDVEPGDLVTLTVAGLPEPIEVATDEVVNEAFGAFVYLSFPHAEQLAGMSMPATAALVEFEDGADEDAVLAALSAHPEVAAVESTNAFSETVDGLLRLFYGFVGVMLAFGGAMAFALIFNAMTVNIAERSREMGTMMAVGMDCRRISRLVTAENLLVTGLSIPVGLVAGWLVAAAAMASFQSDMFRFELYIRPTTYAAVAVTIFVVTLLSLRPGLATLRRMDLAQIVKDRTS